MFTPRRLSLFAAVSSLPIAAPVVQAQVRLDSDGGRPAVSVLSWRDMPFRRVVRQRYDFSCGSAAIATLLSYHYERPMPERAVFLSMWEEGDQAKIRKLGFSMRDMKLYLESIGLRAEGFRLTPVQLRRLGQPGIVILDIKGYKHFVVVKGVRGEEVLVGDPMLGLKIYSFSDFSAMWNGIFLAVLSPASAHPPLYNLAAEWENRLRAPVREVGRPAAITDLLHRLPPLYQISSSINAVSP
ncbi:C39 family peptidase [Sphingobium sp. DC-2]|uniref:C39 family peptidase n=1 Tax=Sphingobium sp. DC-2 TaxID=1303256 RepID=UPI00068B198F|nr:C39 family peptidase [Sphingobium sp. DC-2]